MPTLTTHHIVKRYHRRNVVDGVTVTIKTGEIVGLLGPNGAGKTTSFYMIAGLISPDEGHIRLDGRDITFMPMHEPGPLGNRLPATGTLHLSQTNCRPKI